LPGAAVARTRRIFISAKAVQGDMVVYAQELGIWCRFALPDDGPS